VSSKVWNIFDFISAIVITLLLNKFINSHFGAEAYGTYALSLVFLGTVALFDLGFSNGLTKFISGNKRWETKSKYITSTCIIYFLITVIVSIAFIIIATLNINEISKNTTYANALIISVPLCLAFTLSSSLLSSILIAKTEWSSIVKTNLIYKLSNVIITIILLSELGVDLSFFIVSIMISSLFRMISLILYTKKHLQKHDFFTYNYKALKRLLHLAKYSILNVFSGFLLNQFDKILVGNLLGMVELGYYSFISQITNFIYSFYGVIIKTNFPKLSSFHNEGATTQLKRATLQTYISTTVQTIIILIIVILGWNFGMGYYMDAEYANSTFEIAVLAFIYLVVRMSELNGFYFFNAIAEMKVFSLSTFLISIIFYFSIDVLIETLSINGVFYFKIISTLLFYTISYLFCVLRLKKGRKE